MTTPSLATRARAYTVVVTLIALLSAFALLWFEWTGFIVEDRTASLTRQVLALARGQEVAAGTSGESARLRQQLFRVQGQLIGAALYVTDRRGAVVVAPANSTLKQLPISELSQPDTRGVRTGLRGSGSSRVIVVAAPIGGSGTWLVAVQPLSQVMNATRHLTPIVAVAILIAVAVAFIAGGLFGGRLVRPLERLRDGAEAIAAGDLSARVAEEGDAEPRSLARSFNRMAERVEDTYAAQRAFIGDVSHELRTPITSIRGFAEALADGTASDPEIVARSGAIIRDEAERMDELSRTMLALAELDAGAVEAKIEPVDPLALADVLSGRFAPTAEELGVRLEVSLPVLPRPLGDSARLLQAASALVSNALVYAGEGGHVIVSAETNGGLWRLVVEDDGPGVDSEQREAVFARFTRLDPSRSSKHGGSGLGLPIARRAVDLMGGTIYAEEPRTLSGARFVIELPQALARDERA